MISYPYIEGLFKAILTRSKAIKGRFHTGYRYGLQEINSDLLGEVLKDVVEAEKYPLMLMAPPHSRGVMTIDEGMWERYRIIGFFMKTSYYGTGNTTNSRTNTSTHTVLQDWHDMKRCAVNFQRALLKIQRETHGLQFRVPNNQALYVPMSAIGADHASGIKLDFDLDVFIGCNLEDYDEYPSNLELVLDSHPEHAL